jgi:hypothetical protein
MLLFTVDVLPTRATPCHFVTLPTLSFRRTEGISLTEVEKSLPNGQLLNEVISV